MKTRIYAAPAVKGLSISAVFSQNPDNLPCPLGNGSPSLYFIIISIEYLKSLKQIFKKCSSYRYVYVCLFVFQTSKEYWLCSIFTLKHVLVCLTFARASILSNKRYTQPLRFTFKIPEHSIRLYMEFKCKTM